MGVEDRGVLTARGGGVGDAWVCVLQTLCDLRPDSHLLWPSRVTSMKQDSHCEQLLQFRGSRGGSRLESRCNSQASCPKVGGPGSEVLWVFQR